MTTVPIQPHSSYQPKKVTKMGGLRFQRFQSDINGLLIQKFFRKLNCGICFGFKKLISAGNLLSPNTVNQGWTGNADKLVNKKRQQSFIFLLIVLG
jgi:hypothetical protein